MKGMNMGALALMPSRRSAITWPISWMKIKHDEAGREGPAPEEAVGGDGDERGAGGEEDLGVGQRDEQRLQRGGELGRDRGDAGEGAADALAQPAALGAEGLPLEPGRAGWAIGGGTSRDGGRRRRRDGGHRDGGHRAGGHRAAAWRAGGVVAVRRVGGSDGRLVHGPSIVAPALSGA